MLTTHLDLGSWLGVIGALLRFLYAFVILTRTSPHSSQHYVMGLVVVFNVITLVFYHSFIVSLWNVSLDIWTWRNLPLLIFVREGGERERKLFPVDIAVSWHKSEISFYCLSILWTLMNHTFMQKKKSEIYWQFWHWHLNVQFWDDKLYWCCALRLLCDTNGDCCFEDLM